MPTNIPYQNTVVSPSGGVNALTGVGMDYQFTLSAFTTAAELTINLTDNLTGLQSQFGFGNVTGIVPTFLFAFNDKLYGLAGDSSYFSAIKDGASWNDPNGSGNGFIQMANYTSTPDVLKAVAPYQGQLAFIFRRFVQIWAVDPDPANYKKEQELQNIGTVAPESVNAIGDLDVIMLADNGFRSLRVRDASNNAVISDVGVPVDQAVQPLLASLTDAQKAAACGIVEPSSNRYWCYIPEPDGSTGYIYVFSYFSGSQIAAWSRYLPSYQSAITAPAAAYTASQVTYSGLTVGARYAWKPGANEVSLTNGTQVLTKEGAFTASATTAVIAGSGATVAFTGALSLTVEFIPTKFVVYNGQVYARAGDALYQYGGADNLQYDNCGVTATTPYIDSGTPATRKQFTGIDAAFEGRWLVQAGADYTVGTYKTVYDNNQPTFLYRNIPWTAVGTHYGFNLVESGDAYARFSTLLCHQLAGDEK